MNYSQLHINADEVLVSHTPDMSALDGATEFLKELRTQTVRILPLRLSIEDPIEPGAIYGIPPIKTSSIRFTVMRPVKLALCGSLVGGALLG